MNKPSSRKLVLISTLAICLSSAAPCLADNDYSDHFDEQGPKIAGHWDRQDYQGESFEVAVSPRSFSEVEYRQVGGGSGSQVPYPTVCHYRRGGTPTIQVCNPSDLEPNTGYCAMHGKPSKFILSFHVEKIELLDDPSNSKNCADYIAEQQKGINDGSLSYSFPYDFDADGNLIQYGQYPYKRRAAAAGAN